MCVTGANDHVMADFVPVAKVSEIPDPGRKLVEIDERLVVVFHAAGNFYALDDVCTHDGGPLGEGELVGLSVACPRHGARFDLRDGRALSMPATKPTVVHEVRVVGDQVLVRLSDDA
jgi:3-phenylpropionate/trans-cinnamate dioxygenase ferredoxin component